MPETSPAPGERPAPTQEARAIALREEIPSVVAMATLFVVSLALAILIAPTYTAQGVQAFEDPNDVTNPVWYLVLVVAFTGVILLLARLKLQKVIQVIILGAVFSTIIYVFAPLMLEHLPRAPDLPLPLLGATPAYGLVAAAVALALTLALYYYPEWYVVDAVGVVVSAGSAAIFGISFGLLPSLLLLVGFAVYDAIAVYRTKHMLDLADSVLTLRLPIMFVVPKSKGYSFLEEDRKIRAEVEGTAERKPRDAMFMGLGDVVIPGVLVVSSFVFLNPDHYAAAAQLPHVLGFAPWAFVALCTFLGTLVGYGVLMAFVLRGNPQAGLPSLNGGALLGFLAALVPLYGIAPLLP